MGVNACRKGLGLPRLLLWPSPGHEAVHGDHVAIGGYLMLGEHMKHGVGEHVQELFVLHVVCVAHLTQSGPETYILLSQMRQRVEVPSCYYHAELLSCA